MVIAESATAPDSLAAGLADELARQGYRAAGIARQVRCCTGWPRGWPTKAWTSVS